MALGTERIRKLLMQYALPAIIAMTASSLYNMIDSIFIGHGVGALAISGLALTFPLMNLSAAFGSLVGVGASAIISMRLGQRDYESASTVLGHVITLNVIIGALFALVTLIYLDPILYFFGASEATISYAREYMVVILLGNIITHLFLGLNAVLRASGHPLKSMYATLFTVALNTLLDPLFIYGFGWGIQGAAIATILVQILALGWQLRFFSRGSELLHFRRGIYRLRRKIVRDILSIGLSPFLMNLAACFIVILINKGLKAYGGDLMIGAYGIVNRLSFFFVMIVMGINQGMQPIAGYNYGARNFDRVRKVLWMTVWWSVATTTLGFVICELFPYQVVQIFVSEDGTGNATALIEASARGLRKLVLMLPIVGFNIVAGNFFQHIGKPKRAILLSVSRQMLFIVPLLFILPRWWGGDGVWYSIPIADFTSSVLAAILLALQLRKLRENPSQEKSI